MIILVGGEKGGTGKSTLATTLAAMRRHRGHDVLLIDSDPQGSSSTWAAERAEQEGVAPVVCVSKYGKAFNTQDVRDLATRYEEVVIDAGGRDSRELRGAMVVADRMYTPLQPSYADAWTLDRMEELVDQASVINERLRSFVVLTRAYADPRIPETQDAIRLLEEYEVLRWSGVVICERVDYRRAFGRGLSVEEFAPSEKAALETLKLYEHAYEHEG